MGESPASLPTFGDVLEKYIPDIPSSSVATFETGSSHPDDKTKSKTKWKQLPFPGWAPKTSSSKPSESPLPTTLSPSPIKSRKKASSTLSSPNPISKRGASSRAAGSRYAPPSKYASLTNLLTDSIRPNLITLFIGLNPGIQTATSGHAYAHPSNLFWRLLHSSGCTPRLCRPAEDGDMPRLFDLGLTNIVTRPTKDGAELSKSEMDDGVAELECKIELYRPEAVALVGKSIWESIWRVRHGRAIRKEEFQYGWQADRERMGRKIVGGTQRDEADGVAEVGQKWMGARVFVATTTSGLAASMSLKEKQEIWSLLGGWVKQRRQEKIEAEMASRSKTGAELAGLASKDEVEDVAA